MRACQHVARSAVARHAVDGQLNSSERVVDCGRTASRRLSARRWPVRATAWCRVLSLHASWSLRLHSTTWEVVQVDATVSGETVAV